MQKEVIYLDNEDDITTIIGKLKSASPRIVALVPPKRVGVLQSAVNLRLLARTAEQHDKRLVIITNNHALSTLAASAKIPVAKNLQSKPELGEIAALDIDDGNDVIDGIDLPVGDHASLTEPKSKDKELDKAVGEIATKSAETGAKGKKAKKAVPNFNTFRKKLVIGISAGVLLVGFLVWALVFAPHATVAVTMRTSDISINQLVTLTDSGESDVSKTTLRVESQSASEDISVEFDATGEKDVGEKATGTVNFSNSSPLSQAIEAGTELTSVSGKVYTVVSAVTVPRASLAWCGSSPCASAGTASGDIVASESGESYNGASGTMTGGPSGVSTTINGATSGGTTKMAAIVTEEDITKARKAAESKIDKRVMESKIAANFKGDYVVITDSLQVDTSDFSSSVKKDGEAPNGGAKYGGKAVFKLYAVSNQELKSYLDTLLEKQLDNPSTQRIYDNGAKAAKFSNFRKSGDSLSVSLSTVGKIGPKITEEEVKKQVAGKRVGDIQLTAIEGVSDVDIRFSPFWVKSVPNNTDKITVEFKVDG
jgi:hypothetical protein